MLLDDEDEGTSAFDAMLSISAHLKIEKIKIFYRVLVPLELFGYSGSNLAILECKHVYFWTITAPPLDPQCLQNMGVVYHKNCYIIISWGPQIACKLSLSLIV